MLEEGAILFPCTSPAVSHAFCMACAHNQRHGPFSYSALIATLPQNLKRGPELFNNLCFFACAQAWAQI